MFYLFLKKGKENVLRMKFFFLDLLAKIIVYDCLDLVLCCTANSCFLLRCPWKGTRIVQVARSVTWVKLLATDFNLAQPQLLQAVYLIHSLNRPAPPPPSLSPPSFKQINYANSKIFKCRKSHTLQTILELK